MKTIKLILFTVIAMITLNSCAQNTDAIEGIWIVDNEYNKATYEIIQADKKFFAKVHKYNSESETYIGNNKEDDYFLIDIEKSEEKYTNGKMYINKDELIDVEIQLINKNEIKISMTVEGYPYSEVWKKKN